MKPLTQRWVHPAAVAAFLWAGATAAWAQFDPSKVVV